MKRLTLTLLVSLIGLLAVAGTAAAQGEALITATVDRTTLTTDEAVALTVTVDQSAGASDPQLPPLDDFNVLGTSSGTQISIVNGDMSVQLATTYYLQPRVAGDLLIGPATTSVNGQTVSTDPIALTVAQGTGQFQPSIPSLPSMPSLGGLLPGLPGQPGGQNPPASGGAIPAPAQLDGQEYFAEAVVDNNNPFQGEQIVYTFRFYQGASLLQDPNYDPPAFTGFWSDQQPEQTTYTTEANGRTYFVTELQTVLFPTVSGAVTIDPATLEIPGGFFSAGGVFTTEPIIVNVQSLPPNPPAAFTGGVGQFEIQSAVDTTASQVNDAVTLQVTLTGEGNLPTLADLTWDAGPDWRAFDPQVESSTSLANGRLQGSRVYEQILVPVTAGNLEIPAIPFSYFDPVSEQYITIATEPIAVQVAPDTSAPVPQVGDGAVVAAATTRLGLAPMKAAPSSWRSAPQTLVEQPAYWLLFAIPLFMVGAFGLTRRVQQQRRSTAGDRQRQAAANQARRELEAAAAAADPYAATSVAINTYLTTVLGQPTAGLTQATLSQALRARGVDEASIGRLLDCLQRADLGRYAPTAAAGNSPTSLQNDAAGVIEELDKQLLQA